MATTSNRQSYENIRLEIAPKILGVIRTLSLAQRATGRNIAAQLYRNAEPGSLMRAANMREQRRAVRTLLKRELVAGTLREDKAHSRFGRAPKAIYSLTELGSSRVEGKSEPSPVQQSATVTMDSLKALIPQLAELLKDQIKAPKIDEDTLRKLVEEQLPKVAPRKIEITIDGRKKLNPKGIRHAQVEDVLERIEIGMKNIMLVGPAGSGKSFLAEQVAEALSVEFDHLSLSAGVTETHLFGRMIPGEKGFKYQESAFVRIFRDGGVFLLDEIDAMDANLGVSINAALANGRLANPINGITYKRHPKCWIIAAANTFGHGADHMYVGRNQLDAATLDRYVLATIHLEYDRELELKLAAELCGPEKAKQLVEYVIGLRERAITARLRRLVSMRFVLAAAQALAKNKELDQIKKWFFTGWSDDEKRKVGEGAMM